MIARSESSASSNLTETLESNVPPRPHRAWFSWLFGLALVGAVVLVVAHHSEGQEFVLLLERARPAWLLAATVLQLGTYVADSMTFRLVLRRAGLGLRFRTLVGLGLAKLFIDQAVPSAGLSGTAVVIRGLDRRGVPRGVNIASVMNDLLSYDIAYLVALLAALVIFSLRGQLTAWVAVPAAAFSMFAAAEIGVLLTLALGDRRFVYGWMQRVAVLKLIVRDLQRLPSELVSDSRLLARCTLLKLGVFLLDAATTWTLLLAVGVEAAPLAVFASFMVATLARTIGVVPGGIGTYEAVSVATLGAAGVSGAAALMATLLFRGLSFWLPFVPGIWLARREARGTDTSHEPERKSR